MNNLFLAAIILSGLGLVFGIGLTVANKLFFVPANTKLIELRNALPSANCGGCGYPGCDACADAIFEGNAPINICPVGGNALTEKIALIMGVEVNGSSEKLVARIRCQGNSENCKVKFNYSDIKDCRSALLVSGGNKACECGCLGQGSCVQVCKFNALTLDETTHFPFVNEEKCVSCGACVDICPKHLIELQPQRLPVIRLCMNFNKGKFVKDTCKTGCIACGLCSKKCPENAITMIDNLPIINYDKCSGCLTCATVCPTKAIISYREE